jgi:hypothetical protein
VSRNESLLFILIVVQLLARKGARKGAMYSKLSNDDQLHLYLSGWIFGPDPETLKL